MCATFTDDDVGKTVVNANGDEVGIVSAVEHGSARIEPDPGITDTIKAKLGWEETTGETYPLQEEAVDRVTDDEIRLRGGLSGVGGSEHGTRAGTTGADAGRGTDTRMDDDDELIDTDVDLGEDESRGRDDTRRGHDDDDDELIDSDVDVDLGEDESRGRGDTRRGHDDDELIDSDVDVDLGEDDEEGIADTDIGAGSDRDEDRDSDRDV